MQKQPKFNADEMLKMRESGMTNSDIARVLGCSHGAVLRAIGKQPPSMREYNNTYQPTMSCDLGSIVKQEVKMEVRRAEPQVSLMVESHDIQLAGLFASYHIKTKDNLIEIIDSSSDDGKPHVAMSLSADQLKTFVVELQTIDKKIAGFKPGDEMW